MKYRAATVYTPTAERNVFEFDRPGTWRGIVLRADGTQAYVMRTRASKRSALLEARRRCEILNRTAP